MSLTPNRFLPMLYTNGSTYKADYCDGEIEPQVKTGFKDYSHHKPRPKYEPLKDTHGLGHYKDANVPFTLFWGYDPILRKPFKNIEKPSEELPERERQEAQRTRPRLVITPAWSLDNTEDQIGRRRLCEDIYMSETTRDLRESAPALFNVQAPYPGTNALPQPITLPIWRPPLVSPEWKMDSVIQDRERPRSICDYTSEFWLRQPLPPCRACEETQIVFKDRKLKSLKKANKKPFTLL